MNECIFCVGEPVEIAHSDNFYACLDGYPVSQGHALIIPRRHILSLFDLTGEEVAEMHQVMVGVVGWLTHQYAPAGFNVGVNDGAAAGRTIHHLHVHVIPRYVGDVADPRGGVRNILPGPSPDLWQH